MQQFKQSREQKKKFAGWFDGSANRSTEGDDGGLIFPVVKSTHDEKVFYRREQSRLAAEVANYDERVQEVVENISTRAKLRGKSVWRATSPNPSSKRKRQDDDDEPGLPPPVVKRTKRLETVTGYGNGDQCLRRLEADTTYGISILVRLDLGENNAMRGRGLKRKVSRKYEDQEDDRPRKRPRLHGCFTPRAEASIEEEECYLPACPEPIPEGHPVCPTNVKIETPEVAKVDIRKCVPRSPRVLVFQVPYDPKTMEKLGCKHRHESTYWRGRMKHGVTIVGRAYKPGRWAPKSGREYINTSGCTVPNWPDDADIIKEETEVEEARKAREAQEAQKAQEARKAKKAQKAREAQESAATNAIMDAMSRAWRFWGRRGGAVPWVGNIWAGRRFNGCTLTVPLCALVVESC